MKTVEELLTSALALKSEDKDAIDLYMSFAFPIVQSVILENFIGNNDMRKAGGKVELSEPPIITTLTDEVNYEQYYVNTVMPLGIAAQLFTDDSMSQAYYFEQKYQNARLGAMRTVSTEIENIYGGE